MDQPVNKLFPGRENYVGPTIGMFAFLHHEKLFEESHNVMERVAYVKREKPEREVWIRLHNMMYLDPVLCPAVAKRDTLYADYKAKRAPLYADYKAKRAPLDADYEAKRAPLDADYEAKRDTLDADYEAKCDTLYADYKAKRAPLDADYKAKRDTLDAEILAYIKSEIPDCACNGRTLVFPTE